MSTLRSTKKWNPTPAPPPSPKILHLPRRLNRRHRRRPLTTSILHHQHDMSNKNKLLNLFDQENNISDCARRYKVAESHDDEEEHRFRGEYLSRGGFLAEDEKWRFQAEILRAECSFLRLERELALRKLEKNRVKMERTLRAAVQTLVSGRKKIDEGENVNAVFDEEIEDLAEKLKELRDNVSVEDHELRKCSNFDKKASILQHRLENLGGLSDQLSVQEFQEFADSNISISLCRTDTDSAKVDTATKKNTDNISKDSFDRVEEESVLTLSSIAHSSVSSCASNSMRIDCHELSNFAKKLYDRDNNTVLDEEDKCSGRCKAVIRRIMKQVRAETEQWSQMQEMIAKVRAEMEELQASRSFWENRAHDSDNEIRSLKQTLEEWKEKALSYEAKATHLRQQVSLLKDEAQKSTRVDSLAKQLERAKLASSNRSSMRQSKRNLPMIDLLPTSLGKRLEKAKGVLVAKRSPLRDIGNWSSPLERTNLRAAFD